MISEADKRAYLDRYEAVCDGRAGSDASCPIGGYDAESAKRTVFLAKERDAREDKAWDRRANALKRRREREELGYYESADETPEKPSRAPFVSRALPGCESAPVTINEAGALNHLHKVPQVDGQHASVMQTRSGKWWARVEATLQNICRDETGQFETDEQTRKRKEKEERLNGQGIVICDALERHGVQAFRHDEWQLWVAGVHSHELTEIPAYRRICLNPYVAHRLRLPYLNWLQYFAQGREKSLRFWTFTTGKRVLQHRLGARLKWLHGKLSDLNAQPWMKAAGVQIIFRSTEFGKLEPDKRDASNDGETGGQLEGTGSARWYHPHAHCIVWLSKGKLPRWEWSALLEKVWKFWGHHWDEGKRIRDMREAVKYVVKPGDMVKLAETAPRELVGLFQILYRKKLVQPMGELLLQKRAADIPGLRPVLRWVEYRGRTVQRWKLERDVNRNPLADGSKLSGLYASDGVKSDFRSAFDDTLVPTPTELTNTKAARNFARTGAKFELCENRDALRYATAGAELEGPGVPEWRKVRSENAVCRVIARCSPGYNSRGVKEPRVVVMGSVFDARAIWGHPLVRRMTSATREAYDEGVKLQAKERGGLALLGERFGRSAKPAPIRVHTGTPTVEPPDPGPGLFEPEEAHSAEFGAWLAKN